MSASTAKPVSEIIGSMGIGTSSDHTKVSLQPGFHQVEADSGTTADEELGDDDGEDALLEGVPAWAPPVEPHCCGRADATSAYARERRARVGSMRIGW